MPRNRKGIRECNLPGNRCIRGRDTRITYLYAISTETASRQRAREEGGGKREREIVQGHGSDVISGHETRTTQRRDVSRGSNLSQRPICLPTREKGETKELRERREREREKDRNRREAGKV